MWTEREKEGIRSILGALEPSDLRSLAATVSKRQVVCNSDAECVRVILSFEKSGEEFFHHQKISKKIVAQYAYDKKIKNISGCQSKDDFVRLILKYWSEPGQQVVRRSAPSSASALASSSARREPPRNQASVTNYNFYQVNVSVQSNNHVSYSTSNNNVNSIAQNSSKVDYEFGKTFCNWFFNMLNQPDPVSHGFGPTHFMPQAQMLISFNSHGNNSVDRRTNNIDIANHFIDLSKNFMFNPNISNEGMKVKSDPHGLRLVLVCGTLFKEGSFCGTFQQSFGLIKDPSATDNWKIQVTALKCFKAEGHFVPQLDHSDLELENVAVESLQKSLKM